MTGIDPAQVAAKVINACVSDKSGDCIEHDYDFIPWDDGICLTFSAATEVIRAALEQAWDEGLEAGRDRWMDAREFGDAPVNPYAKEGES